MKLTKKQILDNKLQVARSMAYTDGKASGYAEGLSEGRKEIKHQHSMQEAQVKLELIKAAANAFECISKTILSVNNHL